MAVSLKTVHTRTNDIPANQSSTANPSVRADEDAAALVAVDDGVGRLVLDAIELRRRELHAAPHARAVLEPRRADAAEPRPEPLVLGEELGRDRGRRRGPGGFLVRDLRAD